MPLPDCAKPALRYRRLSGKTNPMNAVRVLCLAALAFALGGCDTIRSRIREKPAVFASLDPATQNKIKQGIIEPGFTTDMVYLARGEPDRIKEEIAHGQRVVIWIYSFPPPDTATGGVSVSTRARAVPPPSDSLPSTFGPPPVPQTVRVVFQDGRVSSITSTD